MIAITFVAVMWGAFSPDTLQNVTDQIQTYITNDFGWYYLLVVSLLVGFCLFFIFSPIGKITLGKPGEEPEFGLFSWFAMLFSAGMGIGLFFTEQLNRSATMLFSHQQGRLKQLRPSAIPFAIHFSTGGGFMHGLFMPLLHFALLTLNLEKMHLA
ncbi:hypothetical protein BsIDN1_52860 [Bacillus safensis]|uniref:Uncharacterized protein n=1 Tax=Bacillus safensis TaxID=561879 RepID=A0A5S9MF59_BACIA|nr:hypothetical protein BsIDN1_52860 [Bacillus safensis]